MSRIFLFFLFSFFINFNVLADGEDDKKTAEEPFQAEGCHGTSIANSECGETVKEGEETPEMTPARTATSDCNPSNCISPVNNIPAVHYPSKDGAYFPTSQTTPSSLPEGGPQSCEQGLNAPNGVGALSCCSDPTTCLGGDGLSTLQDVNNIVTKVGPGLAMMMQGFGKDMSGLCEAMQGLAVAGAGLSMTAKASCSSAISSCVSICDRNIKEQCQTYNTWKNECLANQQSPTNSATPVDSTVTQATTAATLISKHTKTQTLCEVQKANTKDLAENAGEMANSAISAELCKQQAKVANNQKDCRAAGGTWQNLECKMPEPKEEREEVISLRGSDGSAIPQHAGAQMGIGSESPSTNSRDEIPNPDDPNPQLGGGGNPDSPIGPDSPLGPLDVASIDTDSDSDSSTDPSSGKTGGGASGRLASLGGGGGYGGYKGNKKNREDAEKEGSGLSMGGGGFGGYGGGGGFGDSGKPYASLGLSKKKLDELKKKKGAQRVTASEAKGTHQNIFERISKRFQSLCQSKLDCR